MVSFGGTTYTSNSQDSGWVETAHTIPTTDVNVAFNGNRPIKITQVRTYVASYDGVGNIVASIGGFSGTYTSVGIDSSPALSGWLAVSGSFVNAGTATAFRLAPSTGGGVYFKRSGSGTTTKSSGYVWNGTMYGEYLFTEVPVAPTGLTATASGTSGLVSFSWTAPSDNGGSTITGYDIYRGTSSGTVTTLIGSTTGTGTTWSYTAPNSTLYYYHVRAKNAVSTAASTTSQASNVASAAASFSPDDAKPTSLTATPSGTSGQINLAWVAPAIPATPSSYGYRIYRGGSLIHTITQSSNPAETYTATGLTPGVEYSFYVTALSSANVESAASNTATATAPGFAPAPSAIIVSSVIATVVTTSVEVSGQLRLTWTAPAGMTSSGGYKIYRDGGATPIAGVGSVAGTTIGNMTNPTYIDSGLTPGTSYEYTIRAYLADSNEVGTLSAPVSGIPSPISVQAVTDTVDNLTNAEFAGAFDNLVTVVNSTTFSYPVSGGTDYDVQSVDAGFGTVSASLLDIFDTDFAVESVTSTSLVFPYSSTQASITDPIGITATVTNVTNTALSGTYTVDASTSAGSTVKYVVDSPDLPSDISITAVVGSVTNLDSGALNATTTITSVPNASTLTYTLAGVADVAEVETTGTVASAANENIYNNVAQTITAVPRYDTVVYSSFVPTSGPSSEDVDIDFPDETARRTSSTAAAEVQYRSGWIG